MARPSNTSERRAQITSALMRVMAKRGYDGSSIADIAKAARLTPGLVHYHFKNKQEILLAALSELSERHSAELTARLAARDGDPISELDGFIDFHLGLGSDADPEALAMWILMSGEALREAKVRVEFTRAVARTCSSLEGILRRGVADKSFTCDSVEAAASALVALIQGYFVLATSARSLIPNGSAAQSAKRMADGLLHPKRPLASRGGRS